MLSQELIFSFIGMVQYLQVHCAPSSILLCIVVTFKIVVLQKDSNRKYQLSLLSRDTQFFIFNYFRLVELVSSERHLFFFFSQTCAL